jgi:glycosyltransferase involved in cell wall biosynthesis
MKDRDIYLSFCIPTYNNSNSVNRLVSTILECRDSRIEVVVLDNGSTDATISNLQIIDDARLSVYSNGMNRGALFNMVNVLEHGKGKYLVYSTDHDYVDCSRIGHFLSFLIENPKVSFGYCDYNSNSIHSYDIYDSGMPALRELAYNTRHPTGYFFKNEYWKSVDCTSKFCNFDFVDLFPLEFVFAELSLMGDGAIYHGNLFSPEEGVRVTEHKSATTDGNSEKAFFKPKCRLKLAINFQKHIQMLPITSVHKQQLVFNVFFRELKTATFMFKKILANENLCIHYNMKSRKLTKFDLLQIVYFFTLGFCRDICRDKNLSLSNRIKFIRILFTKPRVILGFFYRIVIEK